MSYGNDRPIVPVPDSAAGMAWLYQTGRELSGPQVLDLPKNENPDLYAVYNPATGEIKYRTIESPPLCVAVDTPQDLVDVVLDRGTENSRVFVSEQAGVVGLLEPERPRSRIHLALTQTPTYAAISNGVTGSHERLISMLRNELAGEMTGLLPLLRLVKLTKSSDTQAAAQQGSASVSSHVQRQALFGGKEPPEHCEFQFNLFEQLPGTEYTHSVRCTVNVDIDSGKIALLPLAAELTAARLATLTTLTDFLRNGLRERKVAVFRGSLTLPA